MLSILRVSVPFVLFLSLTSFAGGAADGAEPKVSGIRAYLFGFRTGSVLPKDVRDPSYGLWNTVTDARSTLVVVEVSGPSVYMENEKDYRVRFIAMEKLPKPRKLLDQVQPLTPRNDQVKTYLPFLITPDGCTSVDITATVEGVPAVQPFKTSLDYACGE